MVAVSEAKGNGRRNGRQLMWQRLCDDSITQAFTQAGVSIAGVSAMVQRAQSKRGRWTVAIANRNRYDAMTIR